MDSPESPLPQHSKFRKVEDIIREELRSMLEGGARAKRSAGQRM